MTLAPRILPREKLRLAAKPASQHGFGDLVEFCVDACGCRYRGRVLACDAPGLTAVTLGGAGSFLVATDRLTSIRRLS
ncbi:hypothetical protein K32_24450 [Kaistia sp. 32K]|uniref:hypothetical protein n=1 Tax=Kaistia sp. 32K TaxID=2795690 RepID=UPI0019150BD7|nr:hypothetical protein [Kaistia sp. 32K]BCP53828.1 hypothetical protein K32_24450 [Kaistia sp. 32K]